MRDCKAPLPCGLRPYWETAAKQSGVLHGKEGVQVPSWVGFRFLKWIVLILSERIGSPVFLLTGAPVYFTGVSEDMPHPGYSGTTHLDSDVRGLSHFSSFDSCSYSPSPHVVFLPLCSSFLAKSF